MLLLFHRSTFSHLNFTHFANGYGICYWIDATTQSLTGSHAHTCCDLLFPFSHRMRVRFCALSVTIFNGNWKVENEHSSALISFIWQLCGAACEQWTRKRVSTTMSSRMYWAFPIIFGPFIDYKRAHSIFFPLLACQFHFAWLWHIIFGSRFFLFLFGALLYKLFSFRFHSITTKENAIEQRAIIE